MSETQHTPGPWKYDPGTVMVLNCDGQMTVADIRGWGALKSAHGTSEAVKIQDANGALIAAAPDLLVACEDLVRAIYTEDLEKELREEYDAALAAIRKATQPTGEER